MTTDIEDIGYVEEIRQRMGLEATDVSCDTEIGAMEPLDRVRKICGWYMGSESHVDTFHSWLESQGLYLTTNPEADGVIFKA